MMVPDHFLSIHGLVPEENFRVPRLVAHLTSVFRTGSCWQARDGDLPEIL